MQERRFLIALCSIFFVFALIAGAQDDQPSLGDVARQARQQKQQRDAQPQAASAGKDANAKDAQAAAASNAPIPTAQSNKDAQNNIPNNNVQNNGGQNKPAQTPTAAATASATPGKPPKHVITNDEIPSQGGPTGYRPPVPRSANQEPASGDGQQNADSKSSAAEWTAQIASQKSSIANLQSQIDSLNLSIQYAPGNCVSNCEQWNEAQKKKQDQVDAMKAQLDEAQKHLEEMQEQARQQGYGSSVYEP
jgi:hypothetical protein